MGTARARHLLEWVEAEDAERPFTLGEVAELQRLVSRIASRERMNDPVHLEKLAIGRAAAAGRGAHARER